MRGILRQRGDLEGAVAVLRESVRSAPESFEALYALGLALRQQGKAEEAAQFIQQAETLRRTRESLDAAIFSTQVGIRQLETGDLEGAVRQFQATVSKAPEFAPAHYQLSLALRKLGRNEEAAAALRAATALDPGLRLCRSSLGLKAWLQRQPRGR